MSSCISRTACEMSAPKIYIAGHTGLIGSAALRRFGANEKYRVLTATHRELELRDAEAVQLFFVASANAVITAYPTELGTVGGL